MNRLTFAVLATALPLALTAPAALAATPKDTVVIGWQLDGVIAFDPAESYEIATQEFGTNIYDRLLRAARIGDEGTRADDGVQQAQRFQNS